MSEISIQCPRCQAEAFFEKGFVYLDGEEAKQAKENPAITGVQQGGGFVVARYPKLLSWKHPSNRWHNQSWCDYARCRLFNKHESWGICRCPKCGYLNKHELKWFEDAYYQTVVNGKVLWGWNRQDICDLRDYLVAKDRRRWRHWYFIRHVPKEFKLAKHRVEVVKKLERLLQEK